MSAESPKLSRKISPDFLSKREKLSLTGWKTDRGLFIIASISASNIRENLIFAGITSKSGNFHAGAESVMSAISNFKELPAVTARSAFNREEQLLFTRHLLQVQDFQQINKASLTQDIAWKYQSLIAWGEPSAAKILANEMNVQVRAIHARLRQARLKNELDSPGPGARLGG